MKRTGNNIPLGLLLLYCITHDNKSEYTISF